MTQKTPATKDVDGVSTLGKRSEYKRYGIPRIIDVDATSWFVKKRNKKSKLPASWQSDSKRAKSSAMRPSADFGRHYRTLMTPHLNCAAR